MIIAVRLVDLVGHRVLVMVDIPLSLIIGTAVATALVFARVDPGIALAIAGAVGTATAARSAAVVLVVREDTVLVRNLFTSQQLPRRRIVKVADVTTDVTLRPTSCLGLLLDDGQAITVHATIGSRNSETETTRRELRRVLRRPQDADRFRPRGPTRLRRTN